MTAKRFEVYKVIGSFHEWSIEDNLNDKVVFGCIMHKYEADRLCGLLNELNDENEQLKYNLSAHMVDLNNYKGKCSALEIENEQLKFQLQNTSDQRDEFYRGARENANRVGKLEKENEQLKKAIVETEKMVQSTYDELTKLRCFKKNILRIKHSWDYLMEAIQYD